ncbi:MAG: response regulator transcription factor [Eubacteriales bacterium]
MQKIFVIEDDENIRNLVKVALEGYGYEVQTFENAEDSLEVIEKEQPDLAVFDLMLPQMDGLTAIGKIRKMETIKGIPLVILTAKDKEYDKVMGLDGGADDYITKPFGILELTARIRALLRRATKGREIEEKSMKEGALQINTAIREVKVENKVVNLTFKEYELLLYLVERKARVVGREELLDELWGYDAEIETRTLDIHIRTLRQKLGELGTIYIKTVRSVGYCFRVDS